MSLKEQERLAVEAAPHSGYVGTLGPDCEWYVRRFSTDLSAMIQWWERQSLLARVWAVDGHCKARVIYAK